MVWFLHDRNFRHKGVKKTGKKKTYYEAYVICEKVLRVSPGYNRKSIWLA